MRLNRRSSILNQKQVAQLGKIADELDTAVLAFGIRTDFQGELFEGSKYLFCLLYTSPSPRDS